MISNETLDILANYFIEGGLINKGWEFHEFVSEYQRGTIALYSFNLKSKHVNKFTCLLSKVRGWLN